MMTLEQMEELLPLLFIYPSGEEMDFGGTFVEAVSEEMIIGEIIELEQARFEAGLPELTEEEKEYFHQVMSGS